METLFPSVYFPSISYVAAYLEAEKPLIEIYDTYHKQTYRNRCRVMTANGIQTLSVPVVKVNGNHTMTKDMAISRIEAWQHIHERCLVSAYKKSAYFDHYFDYVKPIFETCFEHLTDLNDMTLQAVLNMLKVKKEIKHTTDYVHEAENDLREALSQKKSVDTKLFPPYYQVFGTKHPFAPDLNVLDLIFNEGPEAKAYLTRILNSDQSLASVSRS